MTKQQAVSDSEFYMWRAAFAFALADREMTDAEKALLTEYKANTSFSPEQLGILRNDFLYPQDPTELYKGITEPAHKHQFCVMARALAWSDGDLDRQDEVILKRVSCLSAPPNNEIMRNSRDHPDLHGIYDQYTKTGMMGFMQTPHLFEMRV